MDDPGIYDLGDFSIAGAGTQVGTVVTGLAGMLAASLQGRFVYGSGGTACKLYWQTSFDQGTTWLDVACMTFGTANETDLVNVSGLTPKTSVVTPTDGALADDTVVDGLLGDRLRAKVVSTGTYATSTTVSVRASVR